MCARAGFFFFLHSKHTIFSSNASTTTAFLFFFSSLALLPHREFLMMVKNGKEKTATHNKKSNVKGVCSQHTVFLESLVVYSIFRYHKRFFLPCACVRAYVRIWAVSQCIGTVSTVRLSFFFFSIVPS